MSRTIQELANEAIQVQDACNLTAVANGLARATKALKEHGFYSPAHPILQLWADKIASLTNTQSASFSQLSDVYLEVSELAGNNG
jgi:hypothetical protein